MSSILTVRRRLIPLNENAPNAEVEIWRHDGVTAEFLGGDTPPGYAPGLLRCFIDGQQVDLDSFDRALATLNLTRDGII